MRTVTTMDGAWSSTSTATPQIPAPVIGAVTSGDGAVTVRWSAPAVAATTKITAYDARYITSAASDKSDAKWAVVEGFRTSGSLDGVLAGLTNGTGYDVQVRAVAATDGAWSATAVGTPAEHGGTLETATTLPLSTRMGGVIESGTDVDLFTLELTAATGVIVYTRGDLDTAGQLLDVDGQLLSENDEGDELNGRHNFLLWGSLQAGTYYVRVTGSGGATGAYVLGTTTVVDSTARSDAQDIEVGGFARGIIDPERTDRDWFRITLTGHTVLLVHTTGPARAWGDLWQSGTGRPPNVDEFPLGGNRFFVRANLSPGTYYVEVGGSGDATGAYTLHVKRAAEPGSSTEAAEPLVPLFPKAGTISPADDVDYFRIELAEATHVVLGASGSAVAIAGELLDADANTVDANIFESRYSLSAPAGFTLRDRLGAGTYYLKVTRLPGSSGPATGRYGLRMSEDYVYGQFFDGCTELTASLSDPLSDPLSGCQWHLDNTGQLGGTPGEDINVREVWAAGHLGEGATVALVDNGFDAGHPDLAPNVIADRNYGYGGAAVYNPGNTHGTGAAGLIAARDNDIGVRGIAPRAQIYVYNIIDAYSHAYAADAMTRGMETTAISNNSWSVTEGPGYAAAPSGWERAVVRGVTEGYGGKGVLYVRSGGNDAVLGANSNLSGFRNHYTTMAACAVTDHGVRSHYSEQGANLWVCAPSGASYLPAAITTTLNDGRYRNTYGGTSATAAIVSGVAALLRGAYADLTWRDVKLILAGSARKNDPSNTGWEEGALQYGSATERYAFNHEYGFGVVDAGAAMDLAAGWTGLPPLPALTEESQASGDVSLAVPDLPSSGTPTTVTSSITMGSGVQFIEFVSIRPSLSATAFRDLEIELVSPSGKVSVLSPHYLVGSRECTSLFGILPGKCDLDGYVRLGSAKHLGEDPAGVWTLRITDHVNGRAAARLNAWSLTVYGHRSSPAAPAIDTVAAGGESLTVTWTAPGNTGASDITAYDVRSVRSDAADKSDSEWTVVDDAWTSTSGALKYTISGLTGNVRYDVQVRAVNAGGDGLWSDAATGTPTTDKAPTIDSVTPGDRSIAVGWTAPTNATLGTVTSYDLRHIRSDASDKADARWTAVTSIWTSGSLEYTLNPTANPLVNGVSYDVQVRAVVGTDQHPWSGVRSAAPRTTPGAPTVDAVTGADGSLAARWSTPLSDGGDEITSYDLRHIKTSEDETVEVNWTAETGVWTSGDLEHGVTGLDDGTRYDVQVRAVNAAGEGAWSATTVGTTRPGAPAIDSLAGVARGLTVAWSAPAADGDAAVSSYDLRYIETSDDETVEANWSVETGAWTSGDLTATVTGLAVGTQHDVQVRAVNASGAGPWSATRTGTTALSDDATLSALTLTGARLSPAFSSGVTSYTASVGYTVMQITIAATTSDGNAGTEILDGSGNTRTDAAGAAGFQVNLSAGENVIQVEVTAPDGVATETYSVTVTRTEEDLSLTPPASDPAPPFASTAIYTIRFRGAWTRNVTPDGLPGGAHFSRLIGAVHSADVTFLKGGGTASAGVESMAEVGGSSTLRGEVNTARNADPPTALSVLEGSTGSIGPTTTRTLSNRTLTTAFPRVTLTTMIAPSHDWFVGVSGLPLLNASGRWLRSHEVDLFPWDAGTEEGDNFSLSPSVATTPRGDITSIRGTGKFTTERIASLAFTLQSVRTDRSLLENTPAGVNIGPPVATAASSGTVSYSLGGTDAASFDLVDSGQLRTKAGVTYDSDTKSSYTVTVTATDADGSIVATVDIAIENIDEPPEITGYTSSELAENQRFYTHGHGCHLPRAGSRGRTGDLAAARRAGQRRFPAQRERRAHVQGSSRLRGPGSVRGHPACFRRWRERSPDRNAGRDRHRHRRGRAGGDLVRGDRRRHREQQRARRGREPRRHARHLQRERPGAEARSDVHMVPRGKRPRRLRPHRCRRPLLCEHPRPRAPRRLRREQRLRHRGERPRQRRQDGQHRPHRDRRPRQRAACHHRRRRAERRGGGNASRRNIPGHGPGECHHRLATARRERQRQLRVQHVDRPAELQGGAGLRGSRAPRQQRVRRDARRLRRRRHHRVRCRRQRHEQGRAGDARAARNAAAGRGRLHRHPRRPRRRAVDDVDVGALDKPQRPLDGRHRGGRQHHDERLHARHHGCRRLPARGRRVHRRPRAAQEPRRRVHQPGPGGPGRQQPASVHGGEPDPQHRRERSSGCPGRRTRHGHRSRPGQHGEVRVRAARFGPVHD